MKHVLNGRVIDAADAELLFPDVSASLLAGLPSDVQTRLAAACVVAPIIGITMPDPADVTTWVLQFAPSATDAQQRQAKAAINVDAPILIMPEPVTAADLDGLKSQLDALTVQVNALTATSGVISAVPLA